MFAIYAWLAISLMQLILNMLRQVCIGSGIIDLWRWIIVQMKDRWKILVSSLSITFVLVLVVACISASFKQVALREYGLLYNELFKFVIDPDVRSNGNYFALIDQQFYKFPAGIVSLQFATTALTKDKTMIEVEGFFAGRLLRDQIHSMLENYGFGYKQFLAAAVEEEMRKAIEYYTLNEIISNRQTVDNGVRGYVCFNLETTLTWISCDYLSLGNLGSNIPPPEILPPDRSFQQQQIQLLNRLIRTQKKLNIYNSGGKEMLKTLQNMNSKLFINITSKISTMFNSSTSKLDAAQYFITNKGFSAVQSDYHFIV